MEKLTLQELKRLRDCRAALDISDIGPAGFLYFGDLTKIAYSTGVNGVNGGLFKDKDGTLFVIIGRTASLLHFM